VGEDELKFSVSNSRHLRSEKKEDLGEGIGLKNVSRRLELLYPGKHELAISDGEEVFEVRLVLRNI
jgi:LytS/YehU family sensor histidine kinase